MLERLERTKSLTVNQWKIVSAAVLGDMLEFFDFYLIGYVLAFVVGGWHLTYGQSALILLSSGVGSIPGAFFWGWLADKIGRRTVFIATTLNFSIATGIMALTPPQGWIFLTVFRFFVGFGVGGLFAVDMPLMQEFVPGRLRGRVSGLSMTLLPLGNTLAAVTGAFLEPLIGWRGLFAVGLLPALLSLLIRAWVPESPRWLVGMGRLEEARRSLAWALQLAPEEIDLPSAPAEAQRPAWRELFRYPRSMAAACLTGISQTGSVGLTLWAATLFVLVLAITPTEASKLMIWVGVAGIVGRAVVSWLSDALGRRVTGMLVTFGAAVTVVIAGHLQTVFIGAVSMFFLMVVVHTFFGNGGYAVVGPYMAEVWPSRLRASGLGLAYGFSNLGKVLGPLGLALIVGTSNYVKPQATLDAIVPAFYYFGAWFLLAGLAFWLLAFETRGRTLEELDAALAKPATLKIPAQ